MSSAILYLAIIAIWALVLIPRWLRRDSARGDIPPVYQAAPGEDTPDTLSQHDGVDSDGADGDMELAGDPVHPPHEAHAPASHAPVNAEESRRRIIAGRRRLLGMLLVLEASAIALAVLHLAAIWVILPPSIMLAGYLLLLREAAHADAERAEHEAAIAAAQARARVRARETARLRDHAQRATPAEGTPAATAAELTAKFAAAPVPEDYEDSGPGRDFAPGLAGKYTTSYADSYADADPVDEDYDDEGPGLRAVGD